MPVWMVFYSNASFFGLYLTSVSIYFLCVQFLQCFSMCFSVSHLYLSHTYLLVSQVAVAQVVELLSTN